MPRISGPLSGWVNTWSLAMNRTSRWAGRAAKPAYVKSRYPTWLMAITAPPCRGTYDGAAQVEAEALRREDRTGQRDDRGVDELGHGQ